MKKTKPQPRKICLWGLETPCLIVNAPTGIVYFNQVAGVACYPCEQEGFVIPLPDMSRNRVFFPEWWYIANHRVDLNEEPGKIMWFDKENAKMKEANTWRHGDEAEELFTEIEDAVNREIEGLKISDFKVIRGVPQYEAWIRATFIIQEPALKPKPGAVWRKVKSEGVLTWQNCD